MNLDHLLSLVRRPELLESSHTAELEALVQEYPYFTAGHLLLLKAYKKQNSIHFKKQLRKVAAIAPDRAQVYALTETWPELEAVEVDEMGEKSTLLETEDLPIQPDTTVEAMPGQETATDGLVAETAVQIDQDGSLEAAAEPVLEAENQTETTTEVTVTEVAQQEAFSTAENQDDLTTETLLPEPEAVHFAFDPAKDEVVEATLQAGTLAEEEIQAILQTVEAMENEQHMPISDEAEVVLAPGEDGAIEFAFDPQMADADGQGSVNEAVATATEAMPANQNDQPIEVPSTPFVVAEASPSLPEKVTGDVQPEVASGDMASPPPAAVLEGEEASGRMMKEANVSEAPASKQPAAEVQNPGLAAEINEEYTVFVARPHDRLSWFRFFAGKPLREQSDDVLEQLYIEHMQQDLLQAPVESPIESIKARVNTAEEVQSSKDIENEIKRLAYDSISDDELPASETLARIYEQQHEYKRAIKIYQKLILKFPDKMTYFAGLIEALRLK